MYIARFAYPPSKKLNILDFLRQNGAQTKITPIYSVRISPLKKGIHGGMHNTISS
jgi:hypothetical protein